MPNNSPPCSPEVLLEAIPLHNLHKPQYLTKQANEFLQLTQNTCAGTEGNIVTHMHTNGANN